MVISLTMGTIAALNRGKAADTIATSVAVLGISMPDFWLSYMLVFAFALGWRIFPAYWVAFIVITVCAAALGLVLARVLVAAFRGTAPWVLPAAVVGALALVLICVLVLLPLISRRA